MKNFINRVSLADTGIRMLVLVAGAAVLIGLQWLFGKVFSGVGTDFLRSGIVSLLSALPLLALCRFVHTSPGLLRNRRPMDAAVVMAMVLFPFLAVALAMGLSWVSPGLSWLIVMAGLFLCAVAEEVFFRGFLLNTLSLSGNVRIGIVLSSVIFALVHFSNFGANIIGLVNVGVFGVLLALARIISDGLIIPSIMHWLWNFLTGMVFGWKVSGFELPSLFRSDAIQPWGDFGPEGSVLLTISLAAGIAASFAFMRRASLR